ncbi:hypothetical protein [Spongiimicrobium salis]|uniref:hypothetical protein n=1 Tax=Spongiimicrobium salis TaxID=1667022 RepID=UPI00374D8FC5
MIRYIDKYKMTTPGNTSWDTAEWRILAWMLSAFMLFILANVFWEVIKDNRMNKVPTRFKIPERQIVIISIREQCYLFLLKTGHYLMLFILLLWTYIKSKLQVLKHKIAMF